jgi:hypothetical protein
MGLLQTIPITSVSYSILQYVTAGVRVIYSQGAGRYFC